MRVTLLKPFSSDTHRGNAVAVERLVRNLRSAGLAFQQVALDAVPGVKEGSGRLPAELTARIKEFQPDLIHGIHVTRCGPLALHAAEALGVPLIISCRGTDINEDLYRPDTQPKVTNVLERADAVIVFAGYKRDAIEQALPGTAAKVTIIPHAVDLPPCRDDIRALHRIPPQAPLVLFPAGIRPVKANRFALEALDPMAGRRSDLVLLCMGPEVDSRYAQQFRADLVTRPWARYIGVVPHHRVSAYLAAADVVLNCSLSEGMPNAILEAMSLGKAVLCGKIPGTSAIIDEGVDGFLFANANECRAKLEVLLEDKLLRNRLGSAARARIARHHEPAQEVERHLSVYRRALGWENKVEEKACSPAISSEAGSDQSG
jgi:glycosyltransferase involved in cell wall biosynthesis